MNPIGTVVVFAGAGASKAIDPDKYPTTVEFFQRLRSGVTEDPLFVEVRKFLENEAGSGGLIDIELLLWRLGELQNFCSAARDRNSLTGWMIKNNRLATSLGLKNHNFGNLEQIAAAASDKVRDLITRIHAQVYDLYGQLPEPEQLESTWKPLIEPLMRSGATLEIVTTNYDMILEVALDELNASASLPVDTGWRGTVQRTLDTTLWTRRREATSSAGLLTKLHGSVKLDAERRHNLRQRSHVQGLRQATRHHMPWLQRSADGSRLSIVSQSLRRLSVAGCCSGLHRFRVQRRAH